MGTRLRPLTDQMPKCMVPLHGFPLIEWQIQSARSAGIEEIVIVAGYRKESLNLKDVTLVFNPEFDSTNMLASLWCAEKFFEDGFLVSYGDIVCQPSAFQNLMRSDEDIAVAVDLNWKSYWEQRFEDALSDAESLKFNERGEITTIGQRVRDFSEIQAQYIGLLAFNAIGVKTIRSCVKEELEANQRGASYLCEGKDFRKMFMTDFLQGMICRGIRVHGAPIQGGWLEIDSNKDLDMAHSLTAVQNNTLVIKR